LYSSKQWSWVCNSQQSIGSVSKGASTLLVVVLARLVLVGRLLWLLLVLVNLRPHYFSCSPGFGAWGSVYLLVVCIGCSTSTSNVDEPFTALHSYSGVQFLFFPGHQLFWGKSWITTSIRPRPFRSKSFQIHHSSTLYNLATHSVLKNGPWQIKLLDSTKRKHSISQHRG
jgi:hypothetical protein